MRNNKNSKISFLVFITFSLCVLGCDFNVFSEKPKKVKEFSYNGNRVYIYKSVSNATTEESIQLRTSIDSVNSKRVFKGYDILLSSVLQEDVLTLVMKDTSGREEQIDTFQIKLDTVR